MLRRDVVQPGLAVGAGECEHATVRAIDEHRGGFGGTLPELALMDLAVRATPIGAEAMGFALLMSARNICALGADFEAQQPWRDRWPVL